MKTEEREDGQDSKKVKDLLHSLPRVNAAPDFEQRLAGKLKEQPKRERRLANWITLQGRIPAPAFSVAALVVAGIASYYAFFRGNGVPADQAPSEYLSSKTAPTSQPITPEPSNQPTPATSDVRDVSDPSGKKAELSRNAEVKDRKEAVHSKQQQTSAAKAVEQPKNEIQKADEEVKANVAVPQEVSKDADLKITTGSGLISQPPQGAAAPTPVTSIAPKMKSMTRPPGAQVQSYSRVADKSADGEEMFQVSLDSIHIRDSIRADSLRKARLDSLKRIRPR